METTAPFDPGLSLSVPALQLQLLFIGVLFVTIAAYDLQEPGRDSDRNRGLMLILVLAIVSMGILLVSKEMNEVSRGFFGLVPDGIPTSQTIAWSLLLDTFFVCALVAMTGGSLDSEFMPALVSIPPIALFLQVDHVSLGFIMSAVTILIIVTMGISESKPYRRRGTARATIASLLLFLFLATYIGWVTEEYRVTHSRDTGRSEPESRATPAQP